MRKGPRVRDLSVRGVYRRYIVEPRIDFLGNDDPALVGDPSHFSVKTDILTPAGGSLRTALESLARIYVGPAEFYDEACDDVVGKMAFTQTWTHIDVRIQLNPDAGLSPATLTAAQATWQAGIEGIWNNPVHTVGGSAAPWKCAKPGEVACRISVKVYWAPSGADHAVNVHVAPPTFREDEKNWYDKTSGWTAAHEFGHMLGLLDEYVDAALCPDRGTTNTGTIMSATGSTFVPDRLVQWVADEIRSTLQ